MAKEVKRENSFSDIKKKTNIDFGLTGKEAKQFKKRTVKYKMERFGFTKEEAEKWADITITTMNEVATEMG